MFVAPFASIAPALQPRTTPRVPPRGPALAPVLVLAWLAAGSVLCACLPTVRDGTMWGATLPFWLIGAPLVDLVWLARHRIGRAMVAGVRWCARMRLNLRRAAVRRRAPAIRADRA